MLKNRIPAASQFGVHGKFTIVKMLHSLLKQRELPAAVWRHKEIFEKLTKSIFINEKQNQAGASFSKDLSMWTVRQPSLHMNHADVEKSKQNVKKHLEKITIQPDIAGFQVNKQTMVLVSMAMSTLLCFKFKTESYNKNDPDQYEQLNTIVALNSVPKKQITWPFRFPEHVRAAANRKHYAGSH